MAMGVQESVSYLVAFGAGLASFLSPCVLPLIPVYVSYLSGSSLEDLSRPGRNQGLGRVRLNALSFVLGFSVVFVALGLSASTIGQLLLRHQVLVRKLSAVLVVLFGLQMSGLLKIGLLEREKRLEYRAGQASAGSSFLTGMAFSLGWTPCVGPILSSILLVAGTGPTVWYGVRLLAVYSAGLAVPFLLTALFLGWSLRRLPKLHAYLPAIAVVGGILMIAFGILLYFDGLTLITRLLTPPVG